MQKLRNVEYYFKVLFIALFCSGAIIGCKNNSGSDHLPPKVMQKALLDISLAEAYCTMVKDTLHKAGTKNYDSLSVYYKEVLDHHKISQGQLSSSLTWYKNHPTELDTIYSAILPVVTRMQSKVGK